MSKISSSTDEKPRFSDRTVAVALIVIFILAYTAAGLVLGWFGLPG